MKTIKSSVTILLIFLVLSFFQVSCRTTERSAVSCPEFSIKKNDKLLSNNKVFRKKVLSTHKVNNKYQALSQSKKNEGKEIKNKKYVSRDLSPVENISDLNKVDYAEGLIASTENIFYPTINNSEPFSLLKLNISEKSKDSVYLQAAKCDTIFLKTGSSLIGKVEEIGQSEIKYRKCNNLAGPLISIPKSDVYSILYSNGTRDLFGPSDTYIPNQTIPAYNINPVLKTEGLGLAGFISGLVGLFVASIPLGIIAVIFGSISLSKIKKQPRRFKGRGFAIASIILGIIDVVAMIALLAAV
jgi:hypothetical protein